MVSFHFQVGGRIFATTFLLDARTKDLCGIWFIDLSKMYYSVAVVCIICNLGLQGMNYHASMLSYFVLCAKHTNRT